MSGNQELFQALNMLTNSVQGLATQRVIANANQQVQDIRASELDEQQKYSQLQQLANGLTRQMAGMGVPATTIQAVGSSIVPHYANANQMFEQGLLTGNQQLQDLGQKAQDFEFNLENKRALIQAKALQVALGQTERNKKTAQAKFGKALLEVDRRFDPQTATKGNIALLAKSNNRIKDAETMLAGDINPQRLHELGRTFDSILSNGAGTIEGSKMVIPSGMAEELWAELKQKAMSKPQNMQVPEWKEYYRESFDRLKAVNEAIIKQARLEGYESVAPGLQAIDPDSFDSKFPEYVKKRLGDDAEYDAKTGRITLKNNPTTQTNDGPEEIRSVKGKKAVFKNKKFVKWL